MIQRLYKIIHCEQHNQFHQLIFLRKIFIIKLNLLKLNQMQLPHPLKTIFAGSMPAAKHLEISPPETTSNPAPILLKTSRNAKLEFA